MHLKLGWFDANIEPNLESERLKLPQPESYHRRIRILFGFIPDEHLFAKIQPRNELSDLGRWLLVQTVQLSLE